MAKKIVYPDWTGPVYRRISCNPGTKGRAIYVWKDIEAPDPRLLRLRVTVEISGGIIMGSLCGRVDGPENRAAACLEDDRRAAWINALKIAELLCRAEQLSDFVVYFRPESMGMGREAVCVSRILPQYMLNWTTGAAHTLT